MAKSRRGAFRRPLAKGATFAALLTAKIAETLFADRYSGNTMPEPPISFGMSFIFGLPSLMRSTVSW